MTDKQRILARLELGPVSPVDFAAPNVCDGGKPVMRVAARVKDLRDEGYNIPPAARAENGTAIYILVKDVDEASMITAGEPASSASSTSAGVIGAPAEPQRAVPGHAATASRSSSLAETAPEDGPLEPLLGVMDDATASDGSPAVAGSLFDTDEFRNSAHWQAA